MRLHRSLAQSGGACYLAQLHLLHKPQQKHCPLPFAQSFHRAPHFSHALLRQQLLLLAGRPAGQPLAGLRRIHGIGARQLPELHPAIAPVILLQVDGNPHQPRHRARVTAKPRPVAVRLQKTFLRQRLRQVHVARGGEQKPEDLRAMACDQARELLRGILFRCCHAEGFQCSAGRHYLGRRALAGQVYRAQR